VVGAHEAQQRQWSAVQRFGCLARTHERAS
jgi:hypothetical protein